MKQSFSQPDDETIGLKTHHWKINIGRSYKEGYMKLGSSFPLSSIWIYLFVTDEEIKMIELKVIHITTLKALEYS